jgi:hypothetical protein
VKRLPVVHSTSFSGISRFAASVKLLPLQSVALPASLPAARGHWLRRRRCSTLARENHFRE